MKKTNLLLTSITLFGLLSFAGCDTNNSSSSTVEEIVTYEIFVKTINGRRVSDVTVEIYKDDTLIESAVTSFTGKAVVEIPKSTYRVELTNLPAGHYYDQSFTLDANPGAYTFECSTCVIDEEMPEKTRYQEDDIIHDFTIEDSKGDDFTLSDCFANGKSLVLINFWATWCTYCIQEFPHFETALDIYGDDFEIFGLTVEPNDTNRLINEFKEDYGISFRMGRDVNYTRYLSFGFTGSVPASVLVNKYGVIEYIGVGAFTERELLDMIDDSLGYLI